MSDFFKGYFVGVIVLWIIWMITAMVSAPKCHAAYYTDTGERNYKSDYNAHESIRPREQEYRPQYDGHKDRYSEAALRNDPEVLVAKAEHDSRPVYPAKDSVVKSAPIPEDVIVSSCVEYNGECTQSEYFQATVK